jgi:hypothetical protein
MTGLQIWFARSIVHAGITVFHNMFSVVIIFHHLISNKMLLYCHSSSTYSLFCLQSYLFHYVSQCNTVNISVLYVFNLSCMLYINHCHDGGNFLFKLPFRMN